MNKSPETVAIRRISPSLDNARFAIKRAAGRGRGTRERGRGLGIFMGVLVAAAPGVGRLEPARTLPGSRLSGLIRAPARPVPSPLLTYLRK